MTSAGAARLGLMDRGLLLKVQELTSYSDPMCYPQGIEYVFVNDTLTVEHDRHTGARAGMPLKYRSAED